MYNIAQQSLVEDGEGKSFEPTNRIQGETSKWNVFLNRKKRKK
jgi:hypothetical protein